jgi:hypothetical protein
MKKLIYLCLTLILFSSCDSNEENLSFDPIIGTWQLVSEAKNGIEITTDCTKQTTLTFLENRITKEIGFYEKENNDCLSKKESSGWINTGNSNYDIIYEADRKKTVKIYFSQNNNVFSIIESETFNDITYTYSAIYQKK